MRILKRVIDRTGDWLKASRAPFFLDVVLCVCVGAAAAWYEVARFDGWGLAACLAGVVLLNAGTNLANDYYDHLSGADGANPNPTPFSGGSRAIQEGTFSPKAIRNAAFVCFALAGPAGAFLVWRSGWPVLVFGGIAVFSGLFYTAPPLRLGYRGFGEVLAGLNVGPVAVLGSYYVQGLTLSWGVVIVSMCPGFLSSALLVINQIPDAEPDRAVGKRHLVARVRLDRAPWGYLVLLVAAYAAAALGVGMRLVPWTVSLVFLAAPIGLWAFAASYRWARSQRAPEGIVPAMAANVACLLLSSALLCAGYLLGGCLICDGAAG